MRKYLLLLLLAATPLSAEDYAGIPQKFFEHIAASETEQAIDYLYGSNRWVTKNSDQPTNLKAELAKLDRLVGSYHYHELVVEERVGSRYAHLIYIVGYDRQPLRFELKLYRPDAEWRFQGVSFDANITDEIEQLANRRLLGE